MGVYFLIYPFLFRIGENMEELYNVWFSGLDLNNETKLDLLEKYDTKEIWEFDLEEFVQKEVPEEEINKILRSKSLEEEKRNLEIKKIENEKLRN